MVRMEAGATTRRFECPALPRGWIREEVYRLGLLSTSNIQVIMIVNIIMLANIGAGLGRRCTLYE